MHGACNNRVQLAGSLALPAAPESCYISWTKIVSKLIRGAKCLCRLCSENQQISIVLPVRKKSKCFSAFVRLDFCCQPNFDISGSQNKHRSEQDERPLNLRAFRVANNAKKNTENKSRSYLRSVTGNY